MTRIRYTKEETTGILVNSAQLLGVNQMIGVEIHPELKAIIYGENVVLKELTSNNLQNLKKLVKKTLIEMGVNFSPEVRPRLKTADLGPDFAKNYKQDLFED